jgi:ribosomal protein L2
MSLHKAKPTSAGRRFVVSVKTQDLHKGKPFDGLIDKKSRKGGRNNAGRITVRHQGGGHKQRYRIVDFKRDKDGIQGVVERLEYDPNRSAHLALVKYADGERRYILAPKGVEAGTPVFSGEDAQIKPGNCLPLKSIPVGTVIHNVEMKPGKGGSWRGRPAPMRSWRPAKAPTRHCGCAPVRRGGFTSTAAPRSARSATANTICGSSARQAPAAGGASGPRCAASR